jgi:predicted transcriptional regulator
MTDIGRHVAEPSEFESSAGSKFYGESDDLTLEDFGQRYVEQSTATVRDVMTPVVHQVPATATISDAARVMVREHIHRLLVTQGKEPVGILTSMDLLRVIAEP